MAIDALEQNIIGGEDTSPSVVALENSPGNWSCTGTLIDRQWVLTAAHCLVGETPATVKIRFDDANINDTTGGHVVAVSELHAHPGFVEIVWDNDIALVKLAEPVLDREPTPIDRTMLAAVAGELAFVDEVLGAPADVDRDDDDDDGGGGCRVTRSGGKHRILLGALLALGVVGGSRRVVARIRRRRS